MVRKRHINEFLKTGFANSGRAAGAGVSSDNYSEESWPDNIFGTKPVHTKWGMSLSQNRSEESPVITYYLTREQIAELYGKEEGAI